MSEIRIQEVQEGAQLMDKLVELLTVGTKWFSDKADAADLAILGQTHQRKSRRRMGTRHIQNYMADLHADQGGVCDYISEREISQITFRADVLFYSVTTESMITE